MSAERYWITASFAVALTVLVASYGAWGWLTAAHAEPFKAMLCLVAQGLANGNAVLARRAFSKERPFMGLIAMALGAGCAAWSAISLHHAWTQDGSDIPWWMTAFLALLEPIMFWFVEEVKLARKPMTPEEIADAALAEAKQPKQPKGRFRSIAGGLTGVAALAALGSSAAYAEPVQHEPITQKATRSDLLAQEPARATAKLMLRQGQTAYAVNKATGVPLTTCKRWAKAA